MPSRAGSAKNPCFPMFAPKSNFIDLFLVLNYCLRTVFIVNLFPFYIL